MTSVLAPVKMVKNKVKEHSEVDGVVNLTQKEVSPDD